MDDGSPLRLGSGFRLKRVIFVKISQENSYPFMW